MTLTIRKAEPRDAETVARFNTAMALETEHLQLDPVRVRAGVEGLLAGQSRGFYLLAESEGRVAGQLMITYEWSDWRNGVFWWIQSVYVDQDYRRLGVFRQLYRRVEELAVQAGDVCGIRLYVERENHRAQDVYRKLGMKPTAYEVYETDYVIQR